MNRGNSRGFFCTSFPKMKTLKGGCCPCPLYHGSAVVSSAAAGCIFAV